MPPLQVSGQVLTVRPAGAYTAMTVVANGIARRFRPGQFVAVSVGGRPSAMILRRAFSIYAVRDRGVYGGTVEFVFSPGGAGTSWLARQRPRDPIELVGPLGRPFRLPRDPVAATLVGGGYGAAPLFSLAEVLRGRGCRVDMVLGASTGDRIFGGLDAKRMASSVLFTTEDGSAGERGRVSDALPEVLGRTGAEVVYACGPMGMLRAVAGVAAAAGIPSQVAVEEAMACGIGVCMTCVLPIIGADGRTRMLRSCLDGPAFDGHAVRFDDIGTVPPDAVGAAVPTPAGLTGGPAAGAPAGRPAESGRPGRRDGR